MEEESGLTVEVGPLLDVLSDVRTLPDGSSLHTVRIVYRIESWSGTLRPESDGTTDAVGWFSPDEAAEMPLAHYVRDVVERLL
jgi:ADP-ribose pyrophosphatase YjhB (NUDIX family)